MENNTNNNNLPTALKNSAENYSITNNPSVASEAQNSNRALEDMTPRSEFTTASNFMAPA